MRRLALLIVAVAVAILGFYALSRNIDVAAVQRIDQDARLAVVLDRLKAAGRTGPVIFHGVAVIDPLQGRATPNQSVVVRDRKIDWIGPAEQTPAVEDALVIDGRGKYLSPGLADMHVHTQGLGEHILRIAAGVTTVREMDGFPWLLHLRDAVERDQTIGATMYVAGTIIADRPLDGYAVVVATPQQARDAVRAQRACGYSFVKVHNSLALPLFDAVAQEAARQGLDLVGHVPHDISLRHAIQSGRMRTLEHLKGFLIDQTLLPSAEDFGQALAGAEVWLTPTLYTRLDFAHGNDAAKLSLDPRMRFTPRAAREAWQAGATAPASNRVQLGTRFDETQRVVMRRLLMLHPRWLAGTDTAGYAFNIAGFALHDELRLMLAAGVPLADALRAATTNAAAAMRLTNFGRIAPGMRADVLLLAANPLEDLGAFDENDGVMARGRWFDRAALDSALAALSRIYDEATPIGFDEAYARRVAGGAEGAVATGHVLEARALASAAAALHNDGFAEAARRLERLVVAPPSGPCAATWPSR
jgi:hypothetical protein